MLLNGWRSLIIREVVCHFWNILKFLVVGNCHILAERLTQRTFTNKELRMYKCKTLVWFCNCNCRDLPVMVNVWTLTFRKFGDWGQLLITTLCYFTMVKISLETFSLKIEKLEISDSCRENEKKISLSSGRKCTRYTRCERVDGYRVTEVESG